MCVCRAQCASFRQTTRFINDIALRNDDRVQVKRHLRGGVHNTIYFTQDRHNFTIQLFT